MGEKRVKKEAKKKDKPFFGSGQYRSAAEKRRDMLKDTDPSYSKRSKKSNSNKS